jgi:hypothetical protein
MTDEMPGDGPRPMAEAEEDQVSEPGDPVDSLTDNEQADLISADAGVAPITYSGQDFDVAGLVNRLRKDDILIPTFGHMDPRITSAGFQRSFVWTRPQMDRFIESLLLGYPVPGIFLVRQADRRYLVLDGQQRLRTLRNFMDGQHEGKDFFLQNVAEKFKGLTYANLSESQRRQVDDTFFQATVVATDGSSESLDAVYQIFERLNAGGTQLTPHEIRVALYAGPFIDYLERLNKITAWRSIFGKKSPRLRDQELVLRILALLVAADEYEAPLKSFLNKFAGRQRRLDQGLDTTAFEQAFTEASQMLLRADGHSSLRPGGPQINVAMTEAVFVALLTRLQESRDIDEPRLAAALVALPNDAVFALATTRATARVENVSDRLRIAKTAISRT